MALTATLNASDAGTRIACSLDASDEGGPTNSSVELKATSDDLDLSSSGNVTFTPSGGLRNINEPAGQVTITWLNQKIGSTASSFTMEVLCKTNAQGSTQVDAEVREVGGPDIATDSVTVAH